MRARPLLLVAFLAGPAALCGQTVSAFNHHGQTFITWPEDTSKTISEYRIFRSTTDSLAPGELVARVSPGSAVLKEMLLPDGSPLAQTDTIEEHRLARIERAVIPGIDSGTAVLLPPGTGVFVWTTEETGPQSVWYRIEKRDSNGLQIGDTWLAGPLTESRSPIEPVRYYQSATRDYYLMWLDYKQWHGCRLGYAFPFALTRSVFQSSSTLPVLFLDGYGTTPTDSYDFSVYGAGDLYRNGLPTWYFGFHDDYTWDGNAGQSGEERRDTITNFIQHRIVRSVLWASRKYSIEPHDLRIRGFSMGATGALGMLTAFPRFVCAVWAAQGLTDFATLGDNALSARWTESVFGNYGRPGLNNPGKFLSFGSNSTDGLDWTTQFSGLDIYTLRAPSRFMDLARSTDFGYLSAAHTLDDQSIPFATQGTPFEAWIRNSRQSFAYAVSPGEHDSAHAIGPAPMFERVSNHESRPGFSDVPPTGGCLPSQPDTDFPGSRTYASYVVWGTSKHPILGGLSVAETESSWVLPIQNLPPCPAADTTYAVDITPRNLQVLVVCPGDRFSYRIEPVNGTQGTQGHAIADSAGLLLVPAVPISREGCLISVKLDIRGASFPCHPVSALDRARVGRIPARTPSPILRRRGNTVLLSFDREMLSCGPYTVDFVDLTGRTVPLTPAEQTTNGTYVFVSSRPLPTGTLVMRVRTQSGTTRYSAVTGFSTPR